MPEDLGELVKGDVSLQRSKWDISKFQDQYYKSKGLNNKIP